MKLRNWKFGGLVIALGLILSACSSSASDSELLSVNNSGRITPLDSLSYDWKDVNIEGGKVSHVYKFKNEGDDDLIIKKAITSCMCTVAEITVGENISPEFGMHDSPAWGFPVKPGQEFSVNVVFDPMAHGPDAVGPIQRSIYLETSSVANGEYAKVMPEMGGSMITELKASGNVMYKEEYEKMKPVSAFFLPETEFDFGVIKQSGGVVTHDFEFEYTGEEPIKVSSLPTSCACTSAKISKKEFKKGDKAILTVEFDPNLHEEPVGKFFKTVNILSEPALAEIPEVKIWVEVDLDLGPEAYKLQEDHDDE